jgi:hypothetical protein
MDPLYGLIWGPLKTDPKTLNWKAHNIILKSLGSENKVLIKPKQALGCS